MYSIIKKLDSVFSFSQASAHCDIPCKIYDPAVAQIAALSVIRFTNLLEEIGAKGELSLADHAQIARLTHEKETHAKKVKDEIVVIWGDYFKAPQFEQFPNISDLVHSILLAGSAAKQHVNSEKSERLLELVNEFTAAYWATKGVETYTATSPYLPSKEVVYPKVS